LDCELHQNAYVWQPGSARGLTALGELLRFTDPLAVIRGGKEIEKEERGGKGGRMGRRRRDGKF